MRKRNINIQILSIRYVLFALLLIMMPGCSEAELLSNESIQRDTIRVQKSDGTEFLFYVEIADDPHEVRQGLMHREFLPQNAGMLFLFDKEAHHHFWMKNTLIPLDMLFIARDGMIHHIHRNAVPQDLTNITSARPAVAVLEINGGVSDAYGIQEGDRVIYKVFRNTH